MRDLEATIVAISTPPGRGGVGCVRLSGDRAEAIAGGLFRATRPGEGTLRFGRFLDRDGRELDHGYLVVFPAGRSFTGEATAELWAHGSPPVLAELVAAAVARGARTAEPGEFTYRALFHERIDLARAEAVRDLVEARTRYQARVAFAQAEGALSRRIAPLRELLEETLARGEAAVEFVEESDVHLSREALRVALDAARAQCSALLSGFRAGRVVRDGATLAMVGLPNVGKSSLFNRLLERERAIVTEIAGTTRDTLEETVALDGIPVRLVDTAGLRVVSDPVEHEGVRRAERARDEADLVVLVLDGSREPEPRERAEINAAARRRPTTVIVVNKCDLGAAAARALPVPGALRVSARTGEGIEGLRGALRERLVGAGPLEDPILTDARHASCLETCLDSLNTASTAAARGLPEEFVMEDVRAARDRLGAITGELGTEALFDRIFSTFCIGK